MTTYTQDQAEAMFSEWLDDVAAPFTYGKLTYQASQVIKLVDPILWREELNNWMDDQEIEEVPSELDNSDAILYAYRSDIEAEYDARRFPNMAIAEEYDDMIPQSDSEPYYDDY
jgi:hypothetical protein